MAAAITGCTSTQFTPNSGVKIITVTTPATADSANTMDITDKAVTGGDTLATLWGVIGAYDNTTGDAVTATWTSAGVITIDVGGGTADHTYRVIAFGK